MDGTTARDLSFAWNGLTLAGTLHLPPGAGPHPTVLMLQGSGAADRDSGGYFPPIRDAFLSRGLATFSFDKPGIGGSTGNWKRYALTARADQALAAIAWLRGLPEVDAARVGVWGQSQGGWLAQLLAARAPDLAFAIANSGPSLTVAEQDCYGCEHTLRAHGGTDDDVRQALAFMDAVHAAARRGDDYATVERELLAPARGARWHGYLDVEDADDWIGLRGFLTEGFEPVEALRQARCPFLAIYGALDVLLPAWQSAQESAAALRMAGNPDATIVVFPQANHRIKVEPSGEFATGYLDLLADWAARRGCALTPNPSPNPGRGV